MKDLTLPMTNLMTEGRLWHVEAPHFVAGVIEAHDGVIVRAAPILRWTCDRPIGWFRRYCQRKGWRCYTLHGRAGKAEQ